MNLEVVDKIVAAVLYEGYILYPYRASAVKNRQRFNFGTLYPRSFSELHGGADVWTMRAECLVEGDNPRLEIRVRFLHPVARQVGRVPVAASFQLVDRQAGSLSPCDYEPVASLEIDDEIHQTWQEVVERDVTVQLEEGGTDQKRQTESVTFPNEEFELLHRHDGKVAGVIVRRQQKIQVGVEVESRTVGDRLQKISATVQNSTPLDDAAAVTREDALLQSLASAHIILAVEGGEFISLLDPPEQNAAAVADCENQGCWPVLVGEEGRRDLMLASPIILYDYPQVAPESAGDFFDGTEIDEMLALRVMTLTDDEKRQMRGVDARARQILERTNSLPQEHLMKLHGTMRAAATTEKQT